MSTLYVYVCKTGEPHYWPSILEFYVIRGLVLLGFGCDKVKFNKKTVQKKLDELINGLNSAPSMQRKLKYHSLSNLIRLHWNENHCDSCHDSSRNRCRFLAWQHEIFELRLNLSLKALDIDENDTNILVPCTQLEIVNFDCSNLDSNVISDSKESKEEEVLTMTSFDLGLNDSASLPVFKSVNEKNGFVERIYWFSRYFENRSDKSSFCEPSTYVSSIYVSIDKNVRKKDGKTEIMPMKLMPVDANNRSHRKNVLYCDVWFDKKKFENDEYSINFYYQFNEMLWVKRNGNINNFSQLKSKSKQKQKHNKNKSIPMTATKDKVSKYGHYFVHKPSEQELCMILFTTQIYNINKSIISDQNIKGIKEIKLQNDCEYQMFIQLLNDITDEKSYHLSLSRLQHLTITVCDFKSVFKLHNDKFARDVSMVNLFRLFLIKMVEFDININMNNKRSKSSNISLSTRNELLNIVQVCQTYKFENHMTYYLPLTADFENIRAHISKTEQLDQLPQTLTKENEDNFLNLWRCFLGMFIHSVLSFCCFVVGF